MADDQISRRLEELRLKQEDLDDVRAQIASMQAQLGARTKDSSFVRRAGALVADLLKRGGESAAAELGKRLIDCLPPM